MYSIYILYSEKADKYYVGQSNDVDRRLEEHNTSLRNTYTSKYRPWRIAKVFEVGASLGKARKIENHIKRQKSRKYIQALIEKDSIEDLLKRFEDEG